MAPKIRKATHTHPGQGALFDERGAVIVPTPAELHPGELELLARRRFADLLRHRDRIEVAAGLTTLLGYRVTTGMIDTYTAPSRAANRLPFTWAMASERLLGATNLSDLWGEVEGGMMIRGEQVVTFRLGELAQQSRALRDFFDGRAH